MLTDYQTCCSAIGMRCKACVHVLHTATHTPTAEYTRTHTGSYMQAKKRRALDGQAATAVLVAPVCLPQHLPLPRLLPHSLAGSLLAQAEESMLQQQHEDQACVDQVHVCARIALLLVLCGLGAVEVDVLLPHAHTVHDTSRIRVWLASIVAACCSLGANVP